MPTIRPFLWFDSKAEEAARFYCSLFKGSKVVNIARYPEGAPAPKGSVMTVTFQLLGQEFIALNGGPHYLPTPAFSMFVLCDTQKQVDTLWTKLTDGGQEVQCGWLTDRYGISWQIIPKLLNKLMQSKDAEKSKRAVQAMMRMKKLDIDALKRAYDGK